MTETTDSAVTAAELDETLRAQASWLRSQFPGDAPDRGVAAIVERAADALAALRRERHEAKKHHDETLRLCWENANEADALRRERDALQVDLDLYEGEIETLRRERDELRERLALVDAFDSDLAEAREQIAKKDAALNLIVSMAPAPMTLAYDMARIARDALTTSQEACPGFDDPEERCPRRIGECVCWQAPAPAISGGEKVSVPRDFLNRVRDACADVLPAIVKPTDAWAAGWNEALDQADVAIRTLDLRAALAAAGQKQ